MDFKHLFADTSSLAVRSLHKEVLRIRNVDPWQQVLRAHTC